MDIKQTLKSLKEKLLAVALSADEQKLLKEYTAKLDGELNPPAPVTLKDVTTKDGKKLSYDGELKEGTPISIVSETGPAPAEGSFELEDGTKITAMAGKVTKLEPAAAPAPTEMPAEMKQQFSVQLAEQENKLVKIIEAKFATEKAALVAENVELKKIQLSTLKTIEGLKTAIENIPVDNIALSRPAKKEYKDMSPAEKYNHDNPID
jgi:hypothetical protein